MTRAWKRRLAASAGALALGAASAHAQTQGPAATAQPAQTAPASPEVQAVIVTAERRAQNIQDVPATVSALTGGQLQAMHAVSLQDLAAYIPGLVVQPQGAAGLETLTIEGIAPTGSAAAARVYVDETPIGSSSGFVASAIITPDVMPYDIQRVEVLDGPQGTLYGANAQAGAIRYVLAPADPTHFSAEVGGDVFGISGASGAGDQFRAELNAPLPDQNFGARATFYQEYSPGYIDDLASGAKDDNPSYRLGGRLALFWQPTPKLTFEFTGLDQNTLQINSNQVEYNPATRQPFAGGGVLSNEVGVPQRFDFNLLLFSGTAKYDLGWANLLSATSYQILSAATVEDETYFLRPAGIPYANLTEYPKVDKFVEEARLTSETPGPVDWLVGAYFTREHSADPEFVYDYSTPGVLLPPPLAVGEVAALNATYNEYAGYADLTWHITPRLDLGGGARYSYNEQVYSQGIGGPLAGGPVTFSPDTSSHEGVFTWDVNPSYHLTHNDMVYARIATGFQPGAPNAIPANVTTAPKFYNSSTLIDYEVGLKSTFLDGRALADISAFYIEWSDIQVLVYYPTCPCTLEGNGGRARSEGVNFDGSYSPITGLRLGATVTYTDAVATSPIVSLDTVAGARLPFAPLWAASLTADYSAPLAGPWSYNLGAAFRYGGKSWGAVQGAEEATPSGLVPTAFLDPAYNVLDLHAGVSGEGWRVSLYVKNVTNDLYLRTSTVLYTFLGTPSYFSGDIAQPRTFGLSVDKSF